MKYPKLREIKGALKSLFSKPYTSNFPKHPHIPFSTFRGKPYYYEDKCIGCIACVNVCPAGALSFKDIIQNNELKRVLEIRWDICIECGQCQLNCPTEEGIKLSNEFDISTTENRKDLCQAITKGMVVCECCNEPIACKDHIIWTIKKLGPLYTSNTTLLSFQQNIFDVGENIKKDTKEILRSDRFRILCPKCRREVVFSS
ncbi:MAG: 4Fe-4S dicluster domain-containing protein [Candidatus Omnitrophota bacterium]|nr:4Fe-4S dicluster domain-containing protein [Candidatus Omnitrophota bacterium]